VRNAGCSEENALDQHCLHSHAVREEARSRHKAGTSRKMIGQRCETGLAGESIAKMSLITQNLCVTPQADILIGHVDVRQVPKAEIRQRRQA
jgi:hypothetical protein